MRDSRGLLILLVVVVVAAAVLYVATRPRSEPVAPVAEEGGPVRFRVDDVPVTSPDLAVKLREVRGAIQPGYASWLVMLTCAEPEGCAGEVAVEVRYQGGGSAHRVVLNGRVDVANGGELRFDGLQDPSTPVERVDRVVLTVLARTMRGAPTPDVID